MRDDVMMKLVDKALSDETFRRSAQSDPEGAARDAGFELEPDELQAVKEFQSDVAGLSDEELNRAISEAPRRQGGNG